MRKPCEHAEPRDWCGVCIAERTQPVYAALFAAADGGRGNPDRFPLPLCVYEGKVSEYAGCGCEDRHIRFCELPGQGEGGIPDIDRMTRAYLPNWDMPSCEKCHYRKEPGSV